MEARLRFMRVAADASRAAGHSWIGVEHLLAGLRRTESAAAEALADVEIPLPPAAARGKRGATFNSALLQVLSFVEGFAAGRSATSEDALVGVLWAWPYPLRRHRDEIAARLRERGVAVPSLPELPPEVERGDDVHFPYVRFEQVMSLLRSRHPEARPAWNTNGRDAWVSVQKEIDLAALVREVMATPLSFAEDGYSAVNWANRYVEKIRERPVLAQVQPGEIRSQLPASPPDDAEPFAAVLRDLDEILLPGITHWNHPRFFAYFAISAPPPGILAELLAATLNVNAMVWSTSPAATELEQTALDWLAQLLGLPREWHGHIEDTASTATVAALAAARTVRPGGVVYASEQANFSVEKAARLLGLEYRTVPVDDDYRMLTDFPLDDATAVVATVGTTATTSVDPVEALVDRCADAGVWLHVDAAYAGSAWVCPELRESQAGCDRADSIVVNPHKWLFTPIDCSALWTRRPEALHAAFAADPAYLRSTEDALNLKDYGPALGRRFRALKLWAVMRCYGRGGLQGLIREHVRLAQEFAAWVRAEPNWEVVAPHPFSTVCFRHASADNDAIVERANATGEVFVAATTLRGSRVIRLAIGNWQTTEDDVRAAWEVLRAAAA